MAQIRFPSEDSNSGVLVPTYAEISQYTAGQLPAAPAAGRTRLYADSNDRVQILGAAGGARRIATHWGSGSSFPTAGALAAGDTFLRTDIGTNGSLWQYTGNTSQGSGGWIAEGAVACTSTTTPTVALYAGLAIYETDTKATRLYDGANWYLTGAAPWIGGISGSWSLASTLAVPQYLSVTTFAGNPAGWAGAGNPTRILPCSGAGYYDLTVAVQFSGANQTGSRGWAFRLNGTGTVQYQNQQTALGAGYGTNLAGTFPGLQLAATDYIEVGIWQDSGSAMTMAAGTTRIELRRVL